MSSYSADELMRFVDYLEANLTTVDINVLLRMDQLAASTHSELNQRMVRQRNADQAALKAKQDKLDLEIQEFHTFENKLKHLRSSDMVTFNVGGTRFSMSREMWCKREPKSYFSHYLSGRYELQAKSDGGVQIDRSPTVFHLVCDYLRGKDIAVRELTKSQLRDLIMDADYYVLAGLLEAIRPTMSFRKVRGPAVLTDFNTVATATAGELCCAFGKRSLQGTFAKQRIKVLSGGGARGLAIGLATKTMILSAQFDHRQCVLLLLAADDDNPAAFPVDAVVTCASSGNGTFTISSSSGAHNSVELPLADELFIVVAMRGSVGCSVQFVQD